jgi:hypothetical protein
VATSGLGTFKGIVATFPTAGTSARIPVYNYQNLISNNGVGDNYRGIYSVIPVGDGSQTVIGDIYGIDNQSSQQGNTTASNVYGLSTNASSFGNSLTNLYGIKIGNSVGSSTRVTTVTNAYGLYISTPNVRASYPAGVLSNYYGLYIQGVDGTTAYSIYSAGGNSYFGPNNAKIYWGTSKHSAIYDNGTNTYISSTENSGTGKVNINGVTIDSTGNYLGTGTLGAGATTLTGNLIFTDASYDIGATGATRPRNLFLSGNATVGGLTATRMTFAGTGGLLSDSSLLTFASATGALTLNTGTFTLTGPAGSGGIAPSPLTILGGIGGTNYAGGLISLISGNGGDGSTASTYVGQGGAITITSGDGGTATSGAVGNTGGPINITSGNGSIAQGTAGSGGPITILSGTGAAGAAAGTGGPISITSGPGSNGTAAAGAGGTLNFTSGAGGNTTGSSSASGGAGGTFVLAGGDGGYTNSTLPAVGGVGGSAYFNGGAGGLKVNTGAYSADGNVYIAVSTAGVPRGIVGIGTNSIANARLTIAAPTLTLAPLKLTAGPLLTTPAAGAIEYSGSDFYGTVALSTDRRQFVTSGSVPSKISGSTLGSEKITNGAFTAPGAEWTVVGNWVAGAYVTTCVKVGTAVPAATAVYSDGVTNYTVKSTTLTSTVLTGYVIMTGAVDPAAGSGTLTKISGTGPTTMTYASWSQVGAHTGTGGTLSQTSAAMVTPLVPYQIYRLTYTMIGRSTGSVTPSIAGATLTTQSLDGVYTEDFVALSTADLLFTPTSTSRFAIDNVTVKQLTGGDLVIGNNLYLTTGSINSLALQTSVNGVTGTAVWSMPFQGTSYKKTVMYLTNFTSAGTVITFPTAFTNAPYVYGDAAAVAIAVTTTTTCTLTSVGAVAGNIIIEGS